MTFKSLNWRHFVEILAWSYIWQFYSAESKIDVPHACSEWRPQENFMFIMYTVKTSHCINRYNSLIFHSVRWWCLPFWSCLGLNLAISLTAFRPSLQTSWMVLYSCFRSWHVRVACLTGSCPGNHSIETSESESVSPTLSPETLWGIKSTKLQLTTTLQIIGRTGGECSAKKSQSFFKYDTDWLTLLQHSSVFFTLHSFNGL